MITWYKTISAWAYRDGQGQIELSRRYHNPRNGWDAFETCASKYLSLSEAKEAAKGIIGWEDPKAAILCSSMDARPKTWVTLCVALPLPSAYACPVCGNQSEGFNVFLESPGILDSMGKIVMSLGDPEWNDRRWVACGFCDFKERASSFEVATWQKAV